MAHGSLHNSFLAAEILAVHCNRCAHRAVLRAAELPKMRNNLTSLRSLKLRCTKCGLRGTGKSKFTLSIPDDEGEAEAFLQGRNIKRLANV